MITCKPIEFTVTGGLSLTSKSLIVHESMSSSWLDIGCVELA